jgi:tRNA(Arg) A34 adenosine deaminase TadA
VSDVDFLKKAIELAVESVNQGGFPAGALIVKNGEVVGEGISVGYKNNDPSGHAQSVAIREACKKLGTSGLTGAVMYESIQSCLMCFSTSYWAKVEKIVFAARKTPEMVKKFYYEGVTDIGEINTLNNRQIEMVHVPEMEEEALKVIRGWEDGGGFGS